MNRLVIGKTASTPSIDFNPATGALSICGESFPENAGSFYAPILDWIKEFMSQEIRPAVTLACDILYFNSSTSKLLMNLFDALESHVREGKDVSVQWICHQNNETAIECGEEFKEDLELLPFHIVTKNE